VDIREYKQSMMILKMELHTSENKNKIVWMFEMRISDNMEGSC
jgi:hypothetical protein